MTDERLRELERRWRETDADDDLYRYLTEIDRAGDVLTRARIANEKLRKNREDPNMLNYILARDTLAYTGWVVHMGLRDLHVIDGSADYRLSVDELCGDEIIQNIAYCDGHLYLITNDFLQRTIPLSSEHLQPTPQSYRPVADHANKRLLFGYWDEQNGTRLVTRAQEETKYRGKDYDYIGSKSVVLSESAINEGEPNLTRVHYAPGKSAHTAKPYLIEDEKTAIHLPDTETLAELVGRTHEETRTALKRHAEIARPFKQDDSRSRAIRLLELPDFPYVPENSRAARRENIASTPYDLGVLTEGGNVKMVEVDLRVLEALRNMR